MAVIVLAFIGEISALAQSEDVELAQSVPTVDNPKVDQALNKAVSDLVQQADEHVEAKNATSLYITLLKLAQLEEAQTTGNQIAVDEVLKKEAAVVSPEDAAFFLENELTGRELQPKQIALTFDDGPHATLTPQVLDVLKQYKIPATFFEIGNRVAMWPKISKMVADGGFVIGNHSWSHPNLTTLSEDGITAEIQKTQAALSQALGGIPFFTSFFQSHFDSVWSGTRQVTAPAFFRTPYGARSRRILDLIDSFKVGTQAVGGAQTEPLHLQQVMWLIDSLDWADTNEQHIATRVAGQLKLLGDRGIILCHDIHPQTLAAIKIFIPELLADGYQFVDMYQVLKAHEMLNAGLNPVLNTGLNGAPKTLPDPLKIVN